ncbi:arginine--tRNA ligase [Nocardioides sp.]|uniref:arginine--tRNA ligase n=1 Tax=Nocardioides sp. TaxID=35761 RepID=UPI002736F09A|nr:arginine--tRNA ligase [Nocardioides sp.]MDP3891178.1 arginine--tRNA ligase [Nocardioides sp.]
MTPEQLSTTIQAALSSLVEDGSLTLPDGVPTSVTVERPRQKGHGDYATNIAMQLAKRAGTNPRALAELVAGRLADAEGVAGVEVAGPGFLNITVEAGAQGALAAQIVAAGALYGHTETLAGNRINVEFISANPTGPLHLGHTRWAVVGDAIARVLEAAGAEVAREFYINDRGNQMSLFGASIAAAALGEPIPQDGYHGAYVADLAQQIVAADPAILELPADERVDAFREAGYALQLKEQQEQLAGFGTRFDVWFSERSLHDSDDVGTELEKLRGEGHLYDSDGALWMRTTDFGDDKDRVLIRTNGELTYFASDTAYYVNKRARGFDRCLYLLGADHHGYVNRLRAMAACAGDDPNQTLEVLIGQLVKIMRGDTEVKLSKRSGELVTLAELVDEIGVDALRYHLVRYPADSPLVLDIEEITRASSDNPVYYVQYAHARVSSILRNAADLGMGLGSTSGVGFETVAAQPPQPAEGFDPSLLNHEREGDLLRALAEFPRVVASAAQLREPHRVARYLEGLASAYHKFYDSCRVLPMGDEDVTDLHHARLVLVAATRTVLANGLALLGVSAPERM